MIPTGHRVLEEEGVVEAPAPGPLAAGVLAGHSTAASHQLPSITKTGNGAIIGPCIWYGLRKRQESISEEVKEIAWKAQRRLHKRYMRLAAAGKDKRKIATAAARELLGFIWAIGTRAEITVRQRIAA
jgi:hypothetical protein